MTFLFALLAAAAAVGYEAMTKLRPDASFIELLLPIGIITCITTQYGIYRLVHSGESIIGALVVFSLCTAALRVAFTLAHGDTVKPAVWVAFALIVFASVLKAVWK